jgi:hypothetical protein
MGRAALSQFISVHNGISKFHRMIENFLQSEYLYRPDTERRGAWGVSGRLGW